jgi:hypothetical protein
MPPGGGIAPPLAGQFHTRLYYARTPSRIAIAFLDVRDLCTRVYLS